MSQTKATAIGFVAVLLWALLALFTAASGQVPPFQLTAMAFAIGAALGVISWILDPKRMRHLKQRPLVWFFGVTLNNAHLSGFLACPACLAITFSILRLCATRQR
jgi:drug/metabolite transporter (DMT)-like permease